MTGEFELRVDFTRNIPFILDSVFEIGLGLFLISKPSVSMTLLVIGWGFVIFGIIQLIRKIKIFTLTEGELIIKHPLFPFPIGEERFKISTIKEVKFIRVKGRFGGRHLTILSSEKSESYRIEASNDRIDEFEAKLKSLGIVTVRDGM
ncbi:hypothetical protein KK083_04835 [Fulvivirgaceae bacterium PWU4]|uniref:Uncharacterized protein n=1 Tax=Chryseosolibacter histidini TaxID=2782349 RepID=A0AAP2GN65_9BACT|nr:hypothetical protein [Chryseosolibacter histidini]MBT1696187.1 hypothetical protein [Chryseosolibacter histidini]